MGLTPLVLSINGRDGSGEVKSSLTNPYRNRELYKPRSNISAARTTHGRTTSLSNHGSHGRDAIDATPGRPGGYLRVRLHVHDQDSVAVNLIRKEGKVNLAPVTLIPKNRPLVIQARGGNGEQGLNGESGGNGKPGNPGKNATEQKDATPGMDGGNGGNAGSGSNGGDGGNGGAIVVDIDERDTILLASLQTDTSPGVGGSPGMHGSPGHGAPGGEGGRAHKWKEWQPMDGSRGTRHPGNNSLEWQERKTMTRPKARCGRSGKSGLISEEILRKGRDGEAGTTQILVYGTNGGVQRFGSPWQVELVDFDITDGNDDGIYEPGDDLIIQTIQVRNTGGMPSPVSTDIPITFIENDWLKVYPDDDPVFLPRSIGPGETAYVSGKLRAFINYVPKTLRAITEPFQAKTAIKLQVILPFFEVPLAGFELTKTISISYPVEIGDVDYLHTVPQGRATFFKWSILNKSTKAYGINSELNRQVHVRITVPQDGGVAFMNKHLSKRVLAPIKHLPIQGISTHQETVQIDHKARSYHEIHYTVSLLLSTPFTAGDEIPFQLIQEKKFALKISNGWSYTSNAQYLLVTNPETTSNLINKWKTFIQRTLMLEVDELDVTLFGGFNSNEPENQNILRMYAGRTIIFLCNPFEYMGQHGQTIFSFMAPALIARDTAFLGTSVILSGALSADHEAHFRLCSWLQQFIRPSAFDQTVSDSARNEVSYNNVHELVSTIQNRNKDGIEVDILANYNVPVRAKSILGRRKSLMLQDSAKTVEILNRNLPQARFSVAAPEYLKDKDNQKSPSYIRILPGVPRETKVIVTAPEILLMTMTRLTNNILPKSEAFACISALPVVHKIRLLYLTPIYGNGSVEQIGSHDAEFQRYASRLALTYECQKEIMHVISSATKDGWYQKPKDYNGIVDILGLFPVLKSLVQEGEKALLSLRQHEYYLLSDALHQILGKTLSAGASVSKSDIVSRMINSGQFVCLELAKIFQIKFTQTGDIKHTTFLKNANNKRLKDADKQTLREIAGLVGVTAMDLKRVLVFADDLVQDDGNIKSGLTTTDELNRKTEAERRFVEDVRQRKLMVDQRTLMLMTVPEEIDALEEEEEEEQEEEYEQEDMSEDGVAEDDEVSDETADDEFQNNGEVEEEEEESYEIVYQGDKVLSTA